MSFIAEQKSQLAKLMATENITVEHKKIKTAGFDPTNRVLYLPIWQDMDGVMYDLLCGHEVGHALYTPAEGWHNAIADESKGKGYKSFLNVIEDARIEKKVKRRYPGLNASFKSAYMDLFKRDFFGIRNRDINEMPFIDRLNVFTKSQYTATNIKFSAQEEVFIRRVQELETWEDVIRVTDDIYAYSKDEMSTWNEFDINSFDMSNDYDDETGDDDSFEFKDSDDETDDDGKNAKTTKSELSDEFVEEDEDDEKIGINRFKDSTKSFEDQFSPYCETDDNYRRNESSLVNEKCKNITYINIPKPIYENILTPAKRVHEILTKEITALEQDGWYKKEQLTTWVNEFKNKNERYIGLLAKEFEMRKAAKAFSKSKLNDTGDIDISKLASYKIDDNIFRKVMLTPKGKSHGLILLLDKSGSMSNNMSGSIEQILILTMFCRKVNIPFIVYGFGDSYEAFKIDRNLSTQFNQAIPAKCFTENAGNLVLNTVRLREYLHSRMSNSEFTKAVRNMIYVMKSFEGASDNSNRYNNRFPRPPSESLSNTPLTQTLVTIAPIMKDFKKKNNLDITNLVIVHDGDSDHINGFYSEKEYVDSETGNKTKKTVFSGFNSYDNAYILRDRENQFETKLFDSKTKTSNHVDTIYCGIIQWFKKTTGSKIFSFYLLPNPSKMKSAINHRYIVKDGLCVADFRYMPNSDVDAHSKHQELMRKLKSEKFLDCNSEIVDGFYLVVAGNELKTEDEDIEIEGKVTAAKLKTAFMKFNKKRLVNRVLVSKFITGIAA